MVKYNFHEQIRVPIDFRDLNNAFLKNNLLILQMKFAVDATTGYEALSFIDEYSGCKPIKMNLNNEEMTVFRPLKGVFTK